MKLDKIIINFFLILSVVLFFSFGFYHLSKFETVDEHFWKFERIPKYWKALKNQEWKKTAINDKPGVSIVLVSGLGLIFERHPELNRIRDQIATKNNLFTVYDSLKIERINMVLRLPVLIFNTLFIFFFFWIIKKITESDWVALFTIMFIALSPVLVGISQIINPDSLLWTFSAAAIFSYFALLKTKEKKFIFLSALFTGFGLLSKYSANIIFPTFILILIANYFVYFNFFRKREDSRSYFFKNILYFFVIWILSILVFVFFMPAAFLKLKYLYRGTIGSPGFSLILWPMLTFIGFIILDSVVFKNYVFLKLGNFFHKRQQFIFKLSSFLMLLVFLVIILNCWLGQKFIAFDELRDIVYQKKNSHFESILENNSPIIEFSKEILIQFYPFVFSQLPLILILVFALWLKIIFGKLEKFRLYIFFCSFFPLLYFPSLLFSNVLANIRYSIMIYPFFAFLGALTIFEFKSYLEKILKISTKKFIIIMSFLILLSGITALWLSKPFYFNYTNILLPNKFIITDSWGYGEYEAAQYLNSLPDAKNLTIWSDRSAICQFLRSGCIRDYKIDITKTKPDYFVISKRGSIRHQFQWKYPDLAKKSVAYYYKKGNIVWSLNIDNREENFVKIIKSEE